MELIYLKPGEPCPEALPGDFVLIKGTALISKLIMLVQPYSHVVTRTRPHFGDAQAHGVVRRSAEVYENTHRVLVRVDATESDRRQMEAFVESVVRAKWEYGYLQFLSVGFSMLTGWRFTFGVSGTSICSGLAAETLVRSGYIFPKTPAHMTPGALAKFFEVEA